MVKKLDARSGPRLGRNIRIGVVLARVEHFTHGTARRNRGMTDFCRANGLDKLRGQDRVPFNTLFDQKTRGDMAQPQCDGGDDQKAAQRKPAQEVELPTF